MRDIRDRVITTCRKLGSLQDPIEHGKRTLRLGMEARDDRRQLLRGLFLEKARLAEGGTDAGHMEKHLLEYPGATP
jgi:hypothetical protein